MPSTQWGTHTYVDLSDLNARWDQDFPGGYNPVYASPVHGLASSNGSLSGNTLAVPRGTGADPHYPWKQYSADTSELQRAVNEQLRAAGCQTLEIDGALGPTTCAAAAAFGMDPGACQEYGTPPPCPGGELPEPDENGASLMGGMEPNWLAIGAAVGLVAIVGAVVYTRQQG